MDPNRPEAAEEKIEVAPALDEIHDPEHWHTLGHVRLRDAVTQKIILLPPPSLDPNDPLRWYVVVVLYSIVLGGLSFC